MRIHPATNFHTHRTGTLTGIGAGAIERVLGFPSNGDLDPDRSRYCWEFLADGQPCSIWSYKNSEQFQMFSTFGPDLVFSSLFGSNYDP